MFDREGVLGMNHKLTHQNGNSLPLSLQNNYGTMLFKRSRNKIGSGDLGDEGKGRP